VNLTTSSPISFSPPGTSSGTGSVGSSSSSSSSSLSPSLSDPSRDFLFAIASTTTV